METSSYIITYRPGIISCVGDKPIPLRHGEDGAAMHNNSRLKQLLHPKGMQPQDDSSPGRKAAKAVQSPSL